MLVLAAAESQIRRVDMAQLTSRVSVGQACNRCIPTALVAEAATFMKLWRERVEMAVTNPFSDTAGEFLDQQIMEQLGLLQDTCPGLFAHKGHEEAYKTIATLNLETGTGLL